MATGIRAGTGALTRTRTEERVKWRKPGNPRSDIRGCVDNANEGVTPSSDQKPQRLTRRLSGTVASCGGPEPGDKTRGIGSGRAEEG